MAMLSWCRDGFHDKCRQTYRRFYIELKTNKAVYLNEVVCECTKVGCACYVAPKKKARKASVKRKAQ